VLVRPAAVLTVAAVAGTGKFVFTFDGVWIHLMMMMIFDCEMMLRP
jgi:hypothetical protein